MFLRNVCLPSSMHYLEHYPAPVFVHPISNLPVGFNETVVVNPLLFSITPSAWMDTGIAGYYQSNFIFCKLFIKVSESGSGRPVFFCHEFMRCRPYKTILKFHVTDF